MNILPRILTFLSYKASHALNESLRIPQRLLALHIAPNRMISYKNFSTTGNDSTTDDLLLLHRNINRDSLLKREKSTQSSCEKDDLKQHQKPIEDHRQSAESCEEPREWRSDGYQISSENYRKICSDLLNHREYCQSIESNSPIYLDKPVPYNNRQACESSKHESYKSKQAILIRSETWIYGKSAMERKIYYKCKPKSCTYPNSRKETICFPSSQDYCKDKSRQTAFYPTRYSVPPSSKKITSKKTSPVERKIPKECHALDTYEYHIKSDPPPPRYQHWSENPPSYCMKKTTCSSSVKASPMIPDKGSRKSRTKDITSSPQNIHEASRTPNENKYSRTDAKAPQKSVPRKRCAISFEDKCAASLTVPAPVNRTMESKIQQFPTLTRDGRCRVEKSAKKFVTPDISDCNPNMASFKYRLSKCPCIKEMWSIGIRREPPVDANVQQEQGALLSRKKMKKSESQPEIARRKRKRFKSRVPGNGWTRQRYKVRLKIFKKRNKLDPCLPRIVELRQPRGEKMRSKLLKFAADEGEIFSQSRNSCSHYFPSKMPIVETKSIRRKWTKAG